MTEGPLSNDELKGIVDRAARGPVSTGELRRLRAAVRVDGDGNVVQVGKYNVRVDSAQNVSVGDRIYRGPDADALRHVLGEAIWSFDPLGPGRLEGAGGATVAAGYVIMVVGTALFALAMLPLLAGSEPPGALPALLIVGLGIGIVGGLVAELGKVGRGWERRRASGNGRWSR